VERWQQIESLFQKALQCDPAERDAYVQEACHGDAELQREVASLLASHHEATDFKPWAAAAAAELIADRTSLEPGQCLGPYRIECFLAAGGMGEVYRATDTRLHREVAIKVSAARFSERFEREARVIASLNHPHICQLYDVGQNYLVMELVEGPTLADRIRKGALPLGEALAIARQIGEALEAAHEKGRVHRDLKPANVKITPEGVVKLLDFGLAKAAEEPAAASDPSDSPTQTISATRAGVILGTAAYMSPEQARGAAVNKRADIWAFGCVLFEMLTGKRAFHGETTSDILAAVLKDEPDWSRIPPAVQPLLRRCLVKDPKHRLRDIGDAMPLLDAVPELATERRPWLWIAIAAVLAITAAMGWWRATRSVPLQPHPLVQLSANLPPGAGIFENGNQVALSPDGRHIVVSMRDVGGKYSLATRRLDQSQFVPLPGTEGAWIPFFSPDGHWIGFWADGKFKKIAVQGEAAVTLFDTPYPGGASWGDDNNIIAALNFGLAGLVRIPSGGGAPVRVTEPSKQRGERSHVWPQVLPGSQAVLFTARTGPEDDDASIDVVLFKTGERKTVQRGAFFGRYLATSTGAGHLVYMHQKVLYAAPFDLSRLEVTAAAQPVLEDVSLTGLQGNANFDFSAAPDGSGTFVYLSRTGEPMRSIFWLDSAGKTQPLHSAPDSYVTPRFSPDGKRLAFSIVNVGPERGEGLWVQDLDRDVVSRLTHMHGSQPVWTLNSANLVFESLRPTLSLYWIRADGSGEAQRLTSDGIRRIPSSFSSDGKRLAYIQQSSDGSNIWTAPVEGDHDHPVLGKAELFLHASLPVTLISAVFSPDGRWLAYCSNETGTYEVYVRPFPGPGGKSPISTGGGRFPIWSRGAPGAARELFFLGPDRHIMAAAYNVNGDSFVAAKPHVWSEKRLLDRPYSTFDLAPDGKRFAVILYGDGTSEPMTQFTVLLNFFDELKRRVPAGGK
jgi:serine/threonine-protein kinase